MPIFKSRAHAKTQIDTAFSGVDDNSVSRDFLCRALSGEVNDDVRNAMFDNFADENYTSVVVPAEDEEVEVEAVMKYKRWDNLTDVPANRPFLKLIPKLLYDNMSDVDLIKYELAYKNRFAPPTVPTPRKESDFLAEMLEHQYQKALIKLDANIGKIKQQIDSSDENPEIKARLEASLLLVGSIKRKIQLNSTRRQGSPYFLPKETRVAGLLGANKYLDEQMADVENDKALKVDEAFENAMFDDKLAEAKRSCLAAWYLMANRPHVDRSYPAIKRMWDKADWGYIPGFRLSREDILAGFALIKKIAETGTAEADKFPRVYKELIDENNYYFHLNELTKAITTAEEPMKSALSDLKFSVEWSIFPWSPSLAERTKALEQAVSIYAATSTNQISIDFSGENSFESKFKGLERAHALAEFNEAMDAVTNDSVKSELNRLRRQVTIWNRFKGMDDRIEAIKAATACVTSVNSSSEVKSVEKTSSVYGAIERVREAVALAAYISAETTVSDFIKPDKEGKLNLEQENIKKLHDMATSLYSQMFRSIETRAAILQAAVELSSDPWKLSDATQEKLRKETGLLEQITPIDEQGKIARLSMQLDKLLNEYKTDDPMRASIEQIQKEVIFRTEIPFETREKVLNCAIEYARHPNDAGCTNNLKGAAADFSTELGGKIGFFNLMGAARASNYKKALVGIKETQNPMQKLNDTDLTPGSNTPGLDN